MSEFDRKPEVKQTRLVQASQHNSLELVREGKDLLRLHAKGTAVQEVQELLNGHNGKEVIRPSGTFDDKTKQLVEQFQKEKELKVDGVVGKNTLATLETRKLSFPSLTKLGEWAREKSHRIADRATLGVAVDFVFSWEGGYTTDTRDRGNANGGATNMGITQPTLNSWCKKNNLPATSVKNLSRGTAAQIYEEQYWKAAKCAQLPTKIAFAHFDTAVNMGVRGANCILQRALGVKVDGVIGKETFEALQKADPDKVLAKYLTDRSHLYDRLAEKGSNAAFLQGWKNRLSGLEKTIDTLASQGALAAVARPKPAPEDVGLQTLDSIKKFQAKAGLQADGVLGPETIKRLLGR